MTTSRSTSLIAMVMLLGDANTRKSVFEETKLEISTVKVSMAGSSKKPSSKIPTWKQSDRSVLVRLMERERGEKSALSVCVHVCVCVCVCVLLKH